MTHHAPIEDHARYNAEMAKSLPDKLFFLDKVKADVWVDFGCGDGSVLGAIEGGLKIGIDSDAEQLAQCIVAGNSKFGFYGFGDLAPKWVRHLSEGKTTAAIFSSVLHESPELLLQAIDFGFDYIIIRDMALLDCWRDQERDLAAAFKLPYWGTPSWEREVKEDYFQLSAEHVLRGWPLRGYQPIYFEHSAVPAIQDRIERDIGIRPEAPTHIKAIWKKVTP